jgi:hypothetical protein
MAVCFRSEVLDQRVAALPGNDLKFLANHPVSVFCHRSRLYVVHREAKLQVEYCCRQQSYLNCRHHRHHRQQNPNYRLDLTWKLDNNNNNNNNNNKRQQMILAVA